MLLCLCRHWKGSNCCGKHTETRHGAKKEVNFKISVMKYNKNLFFAVLILGCALFLVSCQQDTSVATVPAPNVNASATAQSNSSSSGWMSLTELEEQDNVNIFEAPGSYVPSEARRPEFNYSAVYIYQHLTSGENMALFVFNDAADREAAQTYLAPIKNGPLVNSSDPCELGGANCKDKMHDPNETYITINGTTIAIQGWIAVSN